MAEIVLASGDVTLGCADEILGPMTMGIEIQSVYDHCEKFINRADAILAIKHMILEFDVKGDEIE